ncbi:hypothetical protein RB200_11700 [Streptomyces sp. PmtG]
MYGLLGVVGRVEADEEGAHAALVLPDQAGAGEELEEQLRQQQGELAHLGGAPVGPPGAHGRDDRGVVAGDGPPQRCRRCCR